MHILAASPTHPACPWPRAQDLGGRKPGTDIVSDRWGQPEGLQLKAPVLLTVPCAAAERAPPSSPPPLEFLLLPVGVPLTLAWPAGPLETLVLRSRRAVPEPRSRWRPRGTDLLRTCPSRESVNCSSLCSCSGGATGHCLREACSLYSKTRTSAGPSSAAEAWVVRC